MIEEHAEEPARPRGAVRRRLAAARRSRSTTRRVDAPAGTLVFVARPAVSATRAPRRRHDRARVGGKPGGARGSAWEYSFAALGDRRRGSDRAVAELEAGLAEQPDNPALLYNLACSWRERDGSTPRERTSTARSSSIKFAKWADEDEDLDSTATSVRTSRARRGTTSRDGVAFQPAADAFATRPMANASSTIAAPRTMRQLTPRRRTRTPSAIATTGFT